MKFYQKWTGQISGSGEWFPVQVPGDIQADYAKWKGYKDFQLGDRVKWFDELEDETWIYQTELEYERREGERLVFVSEGIEYGYAVRLDGETIKEGTGMFTKVEVDLTAHAQQGSVLQVVIFPHPKREGADHSRTQADQCCKPAVGYGWDWHPRLLVSGMWQETYLETRTDGAILSCEPFYHIAEDYQSARVKFDVQSAVKTTLTFCDADGSVVYQGDSLEFTVDDLRLWWCNGQGEPYLYHWKVSSGLEEVSGTLGFRKVELVLSEGANEREGANGFPMSRCDAPTQLLLNGRPVFAKGSNWVNPEIFTGQITAETYRPLLELAKDANMNLLRLWGGAIINKECFYQLCDEMGIMIWQEFPLACNNYRGTPEYLKILEQEGRSILTNLRRHACVTLWCGGNELLTSWSGMTDQSLALRLLNKLCYEMDPHTPFLTSSPMNGMGHGGYEFYNMERKRDVFENFQQADFCAYTEFGVPSLADVDSLRQIIPKEEWYPVRPGTAWETHHAFYALKDEDWLCRDVLELYFGEMSSVEQMSELSQWLQAEGYKGIFEEARRQRPYCAMALNWCYNEPWITAANNSLLTYPAKPKPAYYAVKEALRPVLFSARIPKFEWRGGESFRAELWLLNDSPQTACGTVKATLELHGKTLAETEWEATAEANQNRKGPEIMAPLPQKESGELILKLASENGLGSEYRLWMR